MASSLTWLECSLCGQPHEIDRPIGLCESCQGVLLARYDIERAAETLTREALVGRRSDLWRYAEMLPFSDDPVSLGEGWTPLRRLEHLGASMGLENLWVKDESLNPTGSFKARGMTAAVTAARAVGVKRLALPSAGNAGGAAAAYGALAGLSVDLFLPRWTPEPFRLEAIALGARVELVDADIADCGAIVRERKEEEGWFDLSTLREPYRLEGKKTMGYELAEQFGWELPDVIVYPTGGGTGLVGMWKAFEEMEQLGLMPAGQPRPRMVVVQSTGCAPVVRAFHQGDETAERWSEPQTYASGLLVPAAIGDRLILSAVRDSGGTALAVEERAMAEGQLAISRQEGIFAAPEGGATVAAVAELLEQGWLRPDERIVLFNTGTGLKYPEIPGLSVP